MKYIIMCGGTFQQWETPRQLVSINGESLVCRTIRLLMEAGVPVADIFISSNNPAFEGLGVPVLHHENNYANGRGSGLWIEAFYPTDEPTCYICGDVLFSPEAIQTIVNTQTNDIEFFASAPPFHKLYTKPWAEPFAFKVVDTAHLKKAVKQAREYHRQHAFRRHPIAWELWQVIKGTELNKIDYTNYTVINDYTCDIDQPEDVPVLVKKLRRVLKG